MQELEAAIERIKKTQYKTEQQADQAKLEMTQLKETLKDISAKREIS
jgi:hypothetical protein